MALSEQEQRIFDGIEASLRAKRPHFHFRLARALAARRPGPLAMTVSGLIVGFVLLVVGLATDLIVLGVLGCVLVVVTANHGVRALARRRVTRRSRRQ